MNTEKIFNERTAKIAKRLAIGSVIIGILALLSVSVLAFIVYYAKA